MKMQFEFLNESETFKYISVIHELFLTILPNLIFKNIYVSILCKHAYKTNAITKIMYKNLDFVVFLINFKMSY